MFGVSFGELTVIALVLLVFVGPRHLPQMLRSLGQWIRRLRIMTSEVREQTGIDDLLRREGLEGGLSELRSMLRGDLSGVGRVVPRSPRPTPTASKAPRRRRHSPPPVADPYLDQPEIDEDREYPPEGVDAAGALPDDLLEEAEPESSTEKP